MTRKFSIILPVRNGGELVKECVASILSQTVADFDLLILENKSTDGTNEWLNSLNDERIRIFPSDRELSIEENWSRILQIPKNEYSTLIGHDDVLMPDYLKVMCSLILSNPSALLFQTHSFFIDAHGAVIRRSFPMQMIMTDKNFVKNALNRKIDISGTGFMFRSEVYNAIKGIPLFPKLMFADYALWFTIIKGGKAAISPEAMFKYRIHRNTSQTVDPFIYKEALFEFTYYLKKLIIDSDELNSPIKTYAPEFIEHYCRSICHKMLRIDLENRNGLRLESIVSCFEEECRAISGNELITFRKNKGIKWALFIDSNPIFRNGFRIFRKLWGRRLLK